MSTKKTRLSAFLLALLLVITALFTIACDNEQQGGDETTTNSSSDSEPGMDSDSSESVGGSSIPDDLRFDGREFSIYCTDLDHKLPTPEDDLGKDAVSEAIWKRNMATEERLGITLNYFLDVNANVSNITLILTDYLLAGDQTYDLYVGCQYGMANLATSGGFYNAYDLEYIDFDNPWWNNRMMEEMSIGTDTRFFLVGDYFISSLERTHTVFFNKNLYKDINSDSPNQLYDWVKDGTWTLEKYAAAAKSAYKDLNNNGVTDASDQLGWIGFLSASTVDPFMYCSNIEFSKHDENGLVTINMLSEKANNLNEAIVNLFYQDGSAFLVEANVPNDTFLDDRALFLGGCTLNTAEYLRDKSGVGILPYPKYEETQERYNSLVADVATMGAVSSWSLNHDIAGAVLEVLSEESYKSVMPAYYETSLKIKYVEGDDEAEMIDYLRDSCYTDFVYMYSPVLSGIGVAMRSTVTSNSTGYISTTTPMQDSALIQLQDLIDLYLNITSDGE